MSLGGLYLEGLIFGILRYVCFPMWIDTPCTTYSIISFYCHSQLQHLTSAGVNRSFKPYSNAGFSSRQQKLWSSRRRKKLMSQAQLASAKRASYQGALGACLLEKFGNLGLLESNSSILEQKLVFEPGRKENHFYSLPFGQAKASIYQPRRHFNQPQKLFDQQN